MMELLAKDCRAADVASADVVDCAKPPIADTTLRRLKTGTNTMSRYQVAGGGKLHGDRIFSDAEVTSRVKSSIASLENLSIFHFPRNRVAEVAGSDQTNPSREPIKFVKRASIARLLGQTYSTRSASSGAVAVPDDVASKATQTQPERFQKCSENHIEADKLSDICCEDNDLGSRALKIISKGLGKFFWKKSYSVDISEPDPEFKVSYLGNVLTGWAKGENCVDKPLATLWRNYTYNNRRDVNMHVRVCSSGLKAATRQHGVTEYWSHRITHCSTPKNNPKVFCWIYRHEGRKLKHELRCHAVLCPKESVSAAICKKLQDNLSRALIEFKRDKVSKQNARLSLVNSVYENPSMPQRKIMLSVGANNYRPPLERSKSAPRLMAIEEAGEEEDGDDKFGKPTVPKESRPCCTVDPLYPAMTLGRRRCKRGHSIRRTGNKPTKIPNTEAMATQVAAATNAATNGHLHSPTVEEHPSPPPDTNDDLDKLLLSNDYNAQSPLAGELMSYLDNRLKMKTTSLLDLQQQNENDSDYLHYDPLPDSINSTLSLDDLDQYSDNEDSTFVTGYFRKSCERSMSDEDGDKVSTLVRKNSDPHLHVTSLQVTLNGGGDYHSAAVDVDENSLSSGCESVSTVTTSIEVPEAMAKIDSDQCRQSVDNASTDTGTGGSSVRRSMDRKFSWPKVKNGNGTGGSDSESEFSDESGYVEYKESAVVRCVGENTMLAPNSV